MVVQNILEEKRIWMNTSVGDAYQATIPFLTIDGVLGADDCDGAVRHVFVAFGYLEAFAAYAPPPDDTPADELIERAQEEEGW